nr:uncharacterized protein LOC110374436 [Helicoverpa armigera]
MGNSRNKKTPKKRKTPNKKNCRRTSSQKENVPKSETKKPKTPKPNGSIAMSKQLMLKKRNANTQERRSSRLSEKCCVNRKPNPSLAELERMYADSDEDDESPKTPSQSPKKEEENLLSPTTISKISQRVMGLIESTDPTELLQEVAPLLEEPPPPVIPVKKRKKSGIPYIVGCKDRPQVIRKPSVKFCKGDEKYGVNSSDNEESDEPAKKRAKPSRIPNYSKSIFNAKSDEIAERLVKEDGEHLSDTSVDSNKTVEYDPTPYQNSRPHSFSPKPSTSRDDKVFMENDQRFNESLKKMKGELDERREVKDLDETMKIEEMDETIKIGDMDETVKIEDMDEVMEIKDVDETIEIKDVDETKAEIKDVSTIDMSYETIVIDDPVDVKPRNKIQNPTSATEETVVASIEPKNLEDVKPKQIVEIQSVPDDNDEDCIIVPNTPGSRDQNTSNSKPIVIEDEYKSVVNMDLDTYTNESIEIIDIDVDDVIAENKSILDKYKDNATKKINRINTVPTSYNNSNIQQKLLTQTNANDKVITINDSENNETNSPSNNQSNTRPQSTPQNQSARRTEPSRNNQIQPSTSSSSLSRNRALTEILKDFFNINPTPRNITQGTNPRSFSDNLGDLFARVVRSFENNARNREPSTSRPVNAPAVSTHTSPTVNNRGNETVRVNPSSNTNRSSNTTSTVNHTSSTTSNVNRTSSTTSNVNPSSKTTSNVSRETNNEQQNSTPTRNLGDCPICLDPLTSAGIASTICGHVFCLPCIQTAIKSNGKKCPTCRKALKGAGGGYHQLFL